LEINTITETIIGAGIEVHRVLGPGLLESAYEECLCHELSRRQVPFERQRPLPVKYKGVYLDCGYRLDVLVAKLGGWQVGLLMNFNVPVLKQGIRRRVLNFKQDVPQRCRGR
jgi:hypothetical protein